MSKSSRSTKFVPWKVSGQFISSYAKPHTCANNFIAYLLCAHLCLDLKVESLGSYVKLLEG